MQCLRPQREKQGEEELVSKAFQDDSSDLPMILAPCSGTRGADVAEQTPSMADAACLDNMSQHEAPGCKPSFKAAAGPKVALTREMAADEKVHAQHASDPTSLSNSEDPEGQQGSADSPAEASNTSFSAPRHQGDKPGAVYTADLGEREAPGQSGTGRGGRLAYADIRQII